MAKAERFSVKPYTTASGEQRWKVQGRKPSGERVRERFKTLEEALGRRSELEVESLNQSVSVRVRSTRLTDAQLAEAEAAFLKLGDKPLLLLGSRINPSPAVATPLTGQPQQGTGDPDHALRVLSDTSQAAHFERNGGLRFLGLHSARSGLKTKVVLICNKLKCNGLTYVLENANCSF